MIFLRKTNKKHTHGNMIFSSGVLKRWSFQKNCSGTWSFLYYLERWVFFPKIWYFFFGRKMKDDICQETHGNLIFFIYTYRCHTHNGTLPCQKMSKMILPAKIHPKVIDVLDWRPRRSSSNFLYFYGDIYRRLHILLSSEKNPDKRNI